jgi:hypothetical protein
MPRLPLFTGAIGLRETHMPHWLPAVAGLLIVVASASAQDRFAEQPAPARPVYVADGLLDADKHHELIELGEWRTDVVFGLPIALRAQHRLGDSAAWGEGGVALYGFVPALFAGVRFDGRIHEGDRNAWFSRPGFDFYYSPVRGSGGFLNRPFRNIVAVTFENDLAWRRVWTDRLHGHLGLKAGFGVAFAGSNVWPVPVLGLTCGFQY